VSLRWAKPVNRRSPGQRTAHLVITMNNVKIANRAIAKGMYVCSKNCRVERVKREPPRCLKCQGWNHFAKECTVKVNVCGNCSNSHRTSECPNPHTRRCTSCKSSDHASWDRTCPEFFKRLSDFNKRNPENSLHFFPTTETWTWSARTVTSYRRTRRKPDTNPPSRPRPPAATHPRRMDTYIPGGDTYIPERDKSRRPNGTATELRWGDRPPSPNLPPAVQQGINDTHNTVPTGSTTSHPLISNE
jgi:hypothetical protein